MKMIEPAIIGNLEIGNGSPKICVPITGRSADTILDQARKIKIAAPDLVEWRGDLFDQIFELEAVENILREIRQALDEIPLLFTFRTKAEGGDKAISKECYMELNKRIAKNECVQMVDVEVFMDTEMMKSLIEGLHQSGTVVIGSHHRFDKTPSCQDMLDILRKIEDAGADILKLAVMPLEEADVNNLLLVTKEAVSNSVSHPVVTMSMGEMGVQSRICGELYGSAMTFACVGEASAPGQMEIEALRKAMQEVHLLVEKF